ncbi:MAG: hypothetical protein ACM65L_22535 [Microcoleus sp.]
MNLLFFFQLTGCSGSHPGKFADRLEVFFLRVNQTQILPTGRGIREIV